MKRALMNVLQLIAVFLFFAAGVFLMALSYKPYLRLQLADVLLERPGQCTQWGVYVVCTAVFFLLGFSYLGRGKFFLIKMGNKIFEIKPKVIEESVRRLFLHHFGTNLTLMGVEMNKSSGLEITVSMKPGELLRDDVFLSAVEKHLSTMLSERFGITKPFTLRVNDV